MATHRTHAELHADPAEDPACSDDVGVFASDIRENFAAWPTSTGVATGETAATSSAIVTDLALASAQSLVGGVVVFTKGLGAPLGGRLQVLHRITKHGVRGPHFNLNIAFHGDVECTDANSASLLTSNAAETGSVVTSDSVTNHLARFANNPSWELVEPLADGSPQTKKIVTRKAMHIPCCLIPCAPGKDLAPKEALHVPHPQMVSLGTEQACLPLVEFLMAASTGTATAPGAPVTVQTSAGASPTGPMASLLHHRRKNFIFRDLPALNRPAGLADMQGLTNAVVAMHDEQTAENTVRRQEGADERAPESVAARWPGTVIRLCRLCQVQAPEDLPNFWQRAAAWKRGTGTTSLGILQDEVDAAAAHLGVERPHVKVQHVTNLQNWQFSAHSAHVTDAGLSPFTIAPPGAISPEAHQSILQATAQASDCVTPVHGNANVNASDARNIHKGGACVPMNFDETEAMPDACAALLAAVLGHHHPVVTSHFDSLINEHKPVHLAQAKGPRLAAATVVHCHHTLMHDWFDRPWQFGVQTSLPPPSFSWACAVFKMGDNISWLPNTSTVREPAALSRPATPPAPPSPFRPADRGARTDDDPSEDNDGVPPVRSRARNRNRDPWLAGDSNLATRIRVTRIRDAAAKAGGPPETTGSGERCLSWHVKGSCFTNCTRASDHTASSGTDEEKLCEWCLTAFPEEQGIGRPLAHPRAAVPTTVATRVATVASTPTMSGEINPKRKSVDVANPEPGKHLTLSRSHACDASAPANAHTGTEHTTPSSPTSPVPFARNDGESPAKRSRQLNPRAAPFLPQRPLSSPAAPNFDPPQRPLCPVAPHLTAPSQRPAKHTREVRTDEPPKHQCPPDALDALIASAAAKFAQADSWDAFFDEQRDPRGDWADVGELNHPAAALLHECKTRGVPVTMTSKPWDRGRRQAALSRGPHKSAKEHIEFLREECVSMMLKGHWVLLPAKSAQAHPELRLSPLGVVPQRDRRPRTMSDCSCFGVNAETLEQAPQEAMQFGRTLQRPLQKIFDADPRFGPVCPSKIDIADGFCRMGLRPADAMKLSVTFPSRPGEEMLVGVPLALPMGWKESPPAFCTATETVADLANEALARPTPELRRAHRSDDTAETPVKEPTETSQPDSYDTKVPRQSHQPKLLKPVRHWDVCADDFLGLVQGPKPLRRQVKRALLHSLDRVFRGPDSLDTEHRQEPASIKKSPKGDATWTTRKMPLGWMVDTVDQTITLPAHRQVRLHEILASVQHKQRTAAEKDWHKILGELRSMAIALPGAKGLFSVSQEAFRHKESGRPRLRLTKTAHVFSDDFRQSANDTAKRPTRLAELFPALIPDVTGACDAAGTGMGGAVFIPQKTGEIHPFLWRAPFPAHVQSNLVSFDDPRGTITNSDLELCGNIAQHDIASQLADVRERTVWTGSDNTANVCWLKKGSTTTLKAPACLLRLQAHHQRFHRHVPMHDCVPGCANAMADMYNFMANLPPGLRDSFSTDLGAAQEAITNGVGPKTATSKDAHWEIWAGFCYEHRVDPFLRHFKDPVPILQVFAHRCRTGQLAPSRKRVTAEWASSVLCSVGQAFKRMGTKDPRVSTHDNRIDFRITQQLRGWRKADAPPSRVKPAPVTLVLFLSQQACSSPTRDPALCATADMICSAFCFLLRPGECTGTTNDDAAFALSDIHLHLGSAPLCVATATDAQLEAATSVHLHFSTQKNQRKGDAVSQGRSHHPLCCPTKAVVRLLLNHRRAAAATDRPLDASIKLASHCQHNRNTRVRAQDITKALRLAATSCFASTGVPAAAISARSLRAGGAMALLCANVDADTIKLLGRWHSDAMMRHLHQQAEPVMRRLAQRMFNRGTHNFLPSDTVPVAAQPAHFVPTRVSSGSAGWHQCA